MKGRWKTLVSVLVFAAIVVLSVWYVHGHAEDFKRILEIDLVSFLWLSLLAVVAIWLMGFQIRTIVGIFDARLGMWEAYGLAAANTMANFYVTKGGIAAKGIYLKRKHGLPYTHFVSTLGGGYVVSLITYGVLGVIAYLLLGANIRLDVMGVFAGLIAVGMLPLIVPATHGALGRFLPARVHRVVEGWDTVRRHRTRLTWYALSNALYVIVGGLRLYVSYRALGYEVGVMQCVVLSTIQTVSVIFTITPGAVGIRQALVGFGSKALGIGAAEGVVASTIDHAVGTLWVFIGGLIFTNSIWVRRVRAQKDPDEEENA